MKLTDHFNIEELIKSSYKTLIPVQLYMLQSLCGILESMRELCQSRIQVTSGVRTYEDFIRLQQQGSNPSEVSDHFCGNTVPLSNEKNIKRFGKFYYYSVGAADITFMDCKTEDAFKKIMDNRSRFITGQIIMEKNKSTWIHVSNHPTLIFSKYTNDYIIKKQPYLVSLNNGKSYQDADTYLKAFK